MKRVISFLMVLVIALTTLTALNVAASAAEKPVLSVEVVKKEKGCTTVSVSSVVRSKVYYTTDGTKPTDKSKKVGSLLWIEEPCKLRLVCYLDGKPIKYLTKNIKVNMPKLSVKTTIKEGATEVKIEKPKKSTLYYTTDGTKPAQKSKAIYPSLTSWSLTIKEPCKLWIVSYIDGKQVDELTKNIKVKLNKPDVMPYIRDEMFTYKLVLPPDGVKAYITQDGTTPSAKNGTLVKNNTFQIPKNSSAQIVYTRKGWISSDVAIVTSGMTRAEEEALKKDKSTFVQQVIDLVNKERVAHGLNKLEASDKLNEVAQLRANEIMTEYSHTRPDGRSCFTALDDANVYYTTSGENIAYGYTTPEIVVQAWMDSPGHRANILNPDVTMIGVGFVCIDNTASGYYWTQEFIG